MKREELQRTVSAVVDSAIGEQVNLQRLGLDRIEPGAALIDDLGIDSVDLLTVVYDIEVALGIKLPISAWIEQAANAGGSTAFTVQALVNHIVDLMLHASVKTT
jgi:acyl carrier protein